MNSTPRPVTIASDVPPPDCPSQSPQVDSGGAFEFSYAARRKVRLTHWHVRDVIVCGQLTDRTETHWLCSGCIDAGGTEICGIQFVPADDVAMTECCYCCGARDGDDSMEFAQWWRAETLRRALSREFLAEVREQVAEIEDAADSESAERDQWAIARAS